MPKRSRSPSPEPRGRRVNNWNFNYVSKLEKFPTVYGVVRSVYPLKKLHNIQRRMRGQVTNNYLSAYRANKKRKANNYERNWSHLVMERQANAKARAAREKANAKALANELAREAKLAQYRWTSRISSGRGYYNSGNYNAKLAASQRAIAKAIANNRNRAETNRYYRYLQNALARAKAQANANTRNITIRNTVKNSNINSYNRLYYALGVNVPGWTKLTKNQKYRKLAFIIHPNRPYGNNKLFKNLQVIRGQYI